MLAITLAPTLHRRREKSEHKALEAQVVPIVALGPGIPPERRGRTWSGSLPQGSTKRQSVPDPVLTQNLFRPPAGNKRFWVASRQPKQEYQDSLFMQYQRGLPLWYAARSADPPDVETIHGRGGGPRTEQHSSGCEFRQLLAGDLSQNQHSAHRAIVARSTVASLGPVASRGVPHF